MTNLPQYETVSITVGRDYRTHGKYEFLIMADEDVILEREGFFKSAATARRAAIRAAEKFLAPALF